jgi:outer membrane protein
MNKTIKRKIYHCFISFVISISPLSQAKPQKILYLDDAISLALAYSPIVEVSRLQHVVDKFSLRLAYNQYEPQYSLGVVGENKGSSSNYLINPAVSWKSEFGLGAVFNASFDDSDSNSASLTMELPLIRGSGDINKIPLDNANDQDEINRLSYRDSVASVIDQVQEQYFNVLSLQKQQEAIKLSLTSSENTLTEYRLKVAAGDMPKANISQQEASITSSKIQLETNIFQLQAAYRKLMLMIGLNPNSNYKIDTDFEPEIDVLPALDASIVKAKEGNYNYKKSIISIRSLERTLRQSQDDARVKLNIAGTVDTNGDNVVSLTASVPINDMSIDYNIVTAKTSLEQAKINLKQEEYDLVSDTTNLIEDLNTKAKQIKLAKVNVSYAKQNYENAKTSNLYGKSSAYEVVSQMQKYLQSEIDLINYKISFYTAYAKLNKFLGLTLKRWQVKLVM